MALEVERKFRLPGAPDWLGDHPSIRIEQGYVVIAEDVEVRLRRSDEERLLTIKRGHGEVREEVEIPLSGEQFDALWPLTESRRLEKVRHLVPLDDLTAEVDVFDAPLDGLTLAEIEFASETESRGFEAPKWLGEEVTGDQRYANQDLARSGVPDSHAT
jgi:adenylate cyclase